MTQPAGSRGDDLFLLFKLDLDETFFYNLGEVKELWPLGILLIFIPEKFELETPSLDTQIF